MKRTRKYRRSAIAPAVEDSVSLTNNGGLVVFCVECNDWRPIRLVGPVTVTARITTARVGPLIRVTGASPDKLTYQCSTCHADVGYLLNGEHRAMAVKIILEN